MDFDRRFRRSEFERHLKTLRVQTNVDELLKRTTKDTRGGLYFSFKPNRVWIGTKTDKAFYAAFEADVAPEGPCQINPPPKNAQPVKSSLWIQFKEQRFTFCMFCDSRVHALNPYRGNIPFEDLAPGGIQLEAEVLSGTGEPIDETRMQANLIIHTRRPPCLEVPLPEVIGAKDAIFDRAATEADYFKVAREEYCEGHSQPIAALGSDEQARLKPGIWLAMKIRIDLTLRQYKLLWMCLVRLRQLKVFEVRPRIRYPLRRLPFHNSSLTYPPQLGQESFPTRYLFEGILSNGIITLPELTDVLNFLRPRNEHDRSRILEGMFTLERDPRRDVKFHIQKSTELMPESRSPAPHRLQVRRCLVSLLRVRLLPPEPQDSNAVLDQFVDYRDRFIRVQFVGDRQAEELPVNFDTIEIDEAVAGKTGVFARIRRALNSGLYIAGRLYIFLASSESQAKERGCWMIAEQAPYFTRQKVLDWMGDFTQERIVAKHAARLGLRFSTSRRMDLDVSLQLRTERDPFDVVNIATGKRVHFTDGAGRASAQVLKRAAKTWGMKTSQTPSAVQIRAGGAKGVLVHDPHLTGSHVVLRESMIKFSAKNRDLRILKVSKHSVASLNKQAIHLMECLGIPSQTFLDILNDFHQLIERWGKDPKSLTLVLDSTFPVHEAVHAGFLNDSMVQNCFNVLRCRLLSDLKWKMSIPIQESAFLLGVPDETNTLLEGQVFCQTLDYSGVLHCVTGTCTVYRNPCLHDGDVRRAEAVDCPALHHLVNVIVFSVRGKRDLPSMLGGGDLDGDMYSLIWDPRLVVPRCHEPMDYSAPAPMPLGREVTVSDTTKFFIDYLLNDVLGRVSNAHLACADLLGADHRICRRLAELHSTAVDFSKTGLPVDASELIDLRFEARREFLASYKELELIDGTKVRLSGSDDHTKLWPDFMAKEDDLIGKKMGNYKIYKSERALGLMFRAIETEPIFEPTETRTFIHPTIERLRQFVPELYFEHATAMKRSYDFEMEGLMRRQSVKVEAECLTGALLKIGAQKKRQRDYDKRSQLRDAYSWLMEDTISDADTFLEENSLPVDDNNLPSGFSAKHAWAVACYTVTFQPQNPGDTDIADEEDGQQTEETAGLEDIAQNSHEIGDEDESHDDSEVNQVHLFSFPWVFRHDLLRCAQMINV